MSRYRRAKVAGGTFFFTVALAQRDSALLASQVENLRASYRSVSLRMPFKTIATCVLPDHLHAIWELPPDDADYSLRWSAIKSGFSRHLPVSSNRSASKQGKREKGIWQRRFWEHQVRDAEDLKRHVNYIHYNPVKHGLVAKVADWPHSSFHRYVRQGMLASDWGGIDPGSAKKFGE